MSMDVIYKYGVTLADAGIDMPAGAELLDIGWQQRGVVVWARVNPEQPTVKRRVVCAMTGEALNPAWRGAKHIGTVTTPEGIVVHALDLGEWPA